MKKVLVVLSVVFAVSAFAGLACTREDGPGAQGQGAAAPADATLGTAAELAPERVGTEAVCPATQESFTVEAATEAAVYQGQLYLFCCPGCRGRFLGNPQQFGAPAPAGGGT
ncbi:MAG: YHS domain-containing protein [Deltaproteobacteria bacterium]|nr:YHS domain-containing protein [Deltaproteobacteria bacterium]